MYLKKVNLKKKVDLVTGAGKGIGKASAIDLAEAGLEVAKLHSHFLQFCLLIIIFFIILFYYNYI